MTTPKTLNKLRSERGWSVQELADQIYDATRIRLNQKTLQRFFEQSVRPTEKTRTAITKFMAAQSSTQGASR